MAISKGKLSCNVWLVNFLRYLFFMWLSAKKLPNKTTNQVVELFISTIHNEHI